MSTATETVVLLLDDLTLDPALQIRAQLDPGTIEKYAELYAEHGHCDALAAISAVRLAGPADQRPVCLVTDGWHRLAAARAAGMTEIRVRLINGTRQTALLLASRANRDHGLPLTSADKRRAVRLVLSDPQLAADADRQIARDLCVSHTLVAEQRRAVAREAAAAAAELHPAAAATAPLYDADDADDADDTAAADDDTTAATATPATTDLDRKRREIDRLVPRLLLAEPSLSQAKARVLLAVFLHTRIADPDFDESGSPITRDRLAALVGHPLDTHPGQLRRSGWIEGDHDGYTISAAANRRINSALSGQSTDDATAAATTSDQATTAQSTTPTLDPGHRRRWLIEQARPVLSQRTEISTRAAQLIALAVGLSESATDQRQPPATADRHQVDATFRRAALDTLIEIATEPATDWDERQLCALLPAIASEIALDWPSLELAADARFGDQA